MHNNKPRNQFSKYRSRHTGRYTAQILRKPDFTTGAELLRLAETLPDAYEDPVTVGTDPEATPHYKALRDQETRDLHAIVGKDYNLFTHREIGEAFGMALQHRGTRVKGKIFLERGSKESQGARLQIIALLDDPDLTVNLPDHNGDVPNYMHLGMRQTNSYDQSLGLNTEFYGVVAACSNGNEFGDMFAKYRKKHTKRVTLDHIDREMERLYATKGEIVQLIETAEQHTYKRKDVPGVYRRLGYGERRTQEMVDLLTGNRLIGHKGTSTQEEYTAWTLYQAATQHLTHDFEGQMTSRSTEYARLGRLLKAPYNVEPKEAPEQPEDSKRKRVVAVMPRA